MSALALILVKRGYIVSGSDNRHNAIVQELESLGVKIFNQQIGENINSLCSQAVELPLIVVSSAILKDNPELKQAQNNLLEIWHRSDLLAALINDHRSIAVAGSHGKTTTSTLITTMLEASGEDPTALIGGLVPCYSSNAHSGHGDLLVAEADESDGTLTKFRPELGIITNLELDHTDHYSNLEEIINTMKEFGNGCQKLLANRDCDILKKNINASAWWSIKRKEESDFTAIPLHVDGHQTIAELYEQGESVGTIKLSMPGLHNLSNAIGAYASCRLMGIKTESLIDVFPILQAPGRRFEYRGNWKGRQIVDDYAHHPSEIYATLTMAKNMVEKCESPLPNPVKRIIVVLQPHRYSRVKEFLKGFVDSLKHADIILIAPVYAAGEDAIEGFDNKHIANELNKVHTNIPVFIGKDLKEIAKLVKENSKTHDLILAMGAGNINSLWSLLTSQEEEESSKLVDLA